MKKLYILSVQYYMQEIDDIDFFLFLLRIAIVAEWSGWSPWREYLLLVARWYSHDRD